MRIAVLGPLEVWDDAPAPVGVPGAKERLLLAVLTAGAPGVVSTERLISSLWDGEAPDTARKSLQGHLVRLRSALEPDRPKGSSGRYVVRQGPGYALALPRGDIDAVALGDLAARGRAQLASGDAPAAVRLLTSGLGLWRGEPYADWPGAAFAAGERRRLAEVRAGASAALIEAELVLGRHAEVTADLERLVAEEPLREEWWRLLMLALYRAGRQAEALAAGRRARVLLAAELGVDPGPGLRDMEAAILAQEPVLDPPPAARAPALRSVGSYAEGACPYKGLAGYQASDAPLFHGRGRLVAGLIARLVDTSLLVVSGPSGAGKSSVVRAGLVPALAGGALPGSDSWRPLVAAPGRRPADALTELTDEIPPRSPVLLICDQLEELWAPVVDPAERSAFLDALLGLIDDGVVARCVVVVRGDHVGRLAEHSAFADRMASGLLVVPALTEAELREIVHAPAQAVGLSAEADLVDAVVADVLGRPGALPLLSAALVGTWERRRGNRLTLAGYLEAGGVEGALARSAEAAYGSLAAEAQTAARRLLVRLADVDVGGTLVRRPVPLGELDLAGENGAARRTALETFVDRRLLSVDGERLDVAHEALLSAWPRLARWLEDDAANRAARRHLARAALEWDARGRPDDDLYRGARLSAALDWLRNDDEDRTPVERDFLDASQGRSDAELDEAHRRADRERAARRRNRRLAVALAAALVLALIGAGLAVRAQRAEARSSEIGEAERLAALSATVDDLQLSMLLAAQGFRLVDTAGTRDGLLSALEAHRRVAGVTTISPFTVAGSLGDGGSTVFFRIGADLVTWSLQSGEQPRTVLALPGEWVLGKARDASPTDAVVAAAGSSGDRPWVRTATPDGDDRVVLDGGAVGGSPVDLAFTPNGAMIDLVLAVPAAAADRSAWALAQVEPATGARRERGISGTLTGAPLSADLSDDGTTAVVWTPSAAVLVDLASGAQTPLRPLDRGGVVLGYRALPGRAAQLWDDGLVTLFGASGRAGQPLERHQAPVRDVVVAPDGTWAVTVGDGAAVFLWEVSTSTGSWTWRESLTGHDGDVREAEIDPAGERLVTMAWGDSAIAWEVGPGGDLRGPRSVTDASEALAEVCAVVGRDLTPAEWNQYLPGRPWQPTCTDVA
jgi:DNA-binding SARP family transcriptional activator